MDVNILLRHDFKHIFQRYYTENLFKKKIDKLITDYQNSFKILFQPN